MNKKIIIFTILSTIAGELSGCGNHFSSETGNIRNEKTEIIRNGETEGGQEDLYNMEEYGTVQESRQEFFDKQTGNISYYYEMEKFFLNDGFPNAALLNQTLEHIYEEYESDYVEEAETHQYCEGESINTPYAYWHIRSVEYAREDYISILYDDVYYMGGAHPYSRMDGITIDCTTGEEVFASQLLGKSDEEVLEEISKEMGMDIIGTWEDIDFYLTDSAIVFFYRMPGFWEEVIFQREI